MKRYFFLTVFLLACLLSCDKASEPVESDRTYSFHTDTLYCQRDGLNIFGIAYVPDGQNRQWPLVIYSHGIGSSHEAGEPYAQVLARKGYAVYTFDFCDFAVAALLTSLPAPSDDRRAVMPVALFV